MSASLGVPVPLKKAFDPQSLFSASKNADPISETVTSWVEWEDELSPRPYLKVIEECQGLWQLLGFDSHQN